MYVAVVSKKIKYRLIIFIVFFYPYYSDIELIIIKSILTTCPILLNIFERSKSKICSKQKSIKCVNYCLIEIY